MTNNVKISQMTEYNHTCIKPGCGQTYKDNEPDDYYCEDCNEQRKKIAKKIDKKIGNRPKRPVKSDLQSYNEMAPRGINGFINARDLGM